MDLGQVANNLGINWKLLLVQIVNFGVVFWILKKYALGPLQNILEEREKKIAKGLEDAQKAETSLMMAESKQKETIENARILGNKIIAEAEKSGKEIILNAKEKAEKEAKETIKQAEISIKEQEKKMIFNVKNQAIDLVFLATEQLLGKELDRKSNQDFVEKLISNKND